jgi:hypothetical protein
MAQAQQLQAQAAQALQQLQGAEPRLEHVLVRPMQHQGSRLEPGRLLQAQHLRPPAAPQLSHQARVLTQQLQQAVEDVAAGNQGGSTL